MMSRSRGSSPQVPADLLHRQVQRAGDARSSSPCAVAERTSSTTGGARRRCMLLVQLRDADARHVQRLVEAIALPPLVGDVDDQQQHRIEATAAPPSAGRRAAAAARSAAAAARRRAAPRPPTARRRGCCSARSARRPCAWRRPAAAPPAPGPGTNLATMQHLGAPALEARLRLVDAGVGGEGDAAQQIHDAAAEEPPGDVPDAVADQAGADARARTPRPRAAGRRRPWRRRRSAWAPPARAGRAGRTAR